MLQLRDYQTEALAAISSAYAKGATRQLVNLPTGTGKTVVFGALAKQMNCRTLIIAHTEELIQQSVDKLRLVWPEVDVGVVKAEQDEFTAQVVVASIQTAHRDGRLESLKAQGFSLLVCDEAHHANAATYRKVFDELGFMSDDQQRLLVGVTATAKRGDGKALGEVFQTIVFEQSIMAMIRAGYSADLRGLRVNTEIDLSDVSVSRGDFAVGELESVVNTEQRNAIVVRTYQKHAMGKKAVAFCCGVDHAKDLAEEFRQAGIAAGAVWGDMPTQDRKEALQSLADGSLSVITNCAVLTEGWDEPSIEAVLMARPTKSSSLYTQCVGRGTRIHPGKLECLIIDFTDKRHGVCGLATLSGKDVKLRSGQSLREADRAAIIKDQEEMRLQAGRVVEESFDLVGRSDLRWVQFHEGSYRMNLGSNECIYLIRQPGAKYTVGVFHREQLVRRLVDVPLELGYAQGVAEDYARRTAGSLVTKNAPWRDEPASLKQIDTLKAFGVNPMPDITKGEAAELLDRTLAELATWKTEPATPKQIWALSKLGVDIPPNPTKGWANEAFQFMKMKESAAEQGKVARR